MTSIPSASGIYKITCTVTGKCYIGSAVNLRERQYNHFSALRRNIHENPKLQNAFNKYGKDAFIFEVLEIVLIPELLTAREQWWFDRERPFGHRGFNIARVAGSSLGREVSQVTRDKLKAFNLGKSPPNLGKKASSEQIEKLRIAHLGQPGYWTGKKRSPEDCKKMGKGRRGKPSPNFGKKASPGTIERLRTSHMGKTQSEEQCLKKSGKLIVTAPDSTEYFVHGIGKFCREHNLHSSGLRQVALGNCTNHKGWRARFPD